jgi:outer membrane protein assembly factor BamE
MQNHSIQSNSLAKSAILSICVLVPSLFAGCSTSLDTKPITDEVNRPIISRLFNPYRPDIVQGNFVSKDQLDSIRPGMTKSQVRQILGTPLIQDYFHKDRWDYTFSYRVGVTQEVEMRNITLLFNDNVLSKINASEVPTDQQFVNEIDQIKKQGRKVDNKVNLSAQDPNPSVNPVPVFQNPTNGVGVPPGGTRLNQ